MPINKDRTHAVAVGLGITYKITFKTCHNRNGELPVYSVIDAKQYLIKISSHNC
jgi:hypothetical protein